MGCKICTLGCVQGIAYSCDNRFKEILEDKRHQETSYVSDFQ